MTGFRAQRRTPRPVSPATQTGLLHGPGGVLESPTARLCRTLRSWFALTTREAVWAESQGALADLPAALEVTSVRTAVDEAWAAVGDPGAPAVYRATAAGYWTETCRCPCCGQAGVNHLEAVPA